MSSEDEEKPKVKKMHEGYHGWMKSIPINEQDFTPVRIDNNFHVKVNEKGNSAWNAAGTWEERDKSEWAKERLQQHILDSFHVIDDIIKISVKAKSIVKCDGEAKIVYSRGKKRCGYDIFLKFEWQSCRHEEEEDLEGFNEVSGHIEIHDFDDTNGEDYEIRVSTEGSSQHEQQAKKAIAKWEPQLRKILSNWKNELLEQ